MARKRKIDMTGVESYSKASEGIHTAKIVEILEKSSQGGDDMLQFAFEIIKGEDKGSRVFESFVLTDKALWKLKSCLQALGMKADGKMVLDLDKLIGKICDIEVFHDDYNGQKRAKISDYYKAGKGAASSEDTEDEDIDEEDDDEEEEAPPKKSAKKTPAKKTPAPKGKKKPVEEDEDDEDEDDDFDEDEEEEEPAPKKKSKKPAPAKSKKPAAKGKKKPEPEEEDEDDDDDDDWEEDDD